MPIVKSARRQEVDARLADALACLKNVNGVTHFESHADFILSASMLLKLLTLAPSITARESEGIVTRSLLNMFHDGESSIGAFEIRAQEMQTERLKQTRRTYHLLASVRANKKLLPTNGNFFTATIGPVQLRFARDFPKRAKVAPFHIGSHKIDLRGSKPYVAVWATLKARSELEAADRAVEATKAALGCVNLVLNHNVQRSHSGRRLPRNTVRLVGEQIIYRSDWSRYDDHFFYEAESENPERWPVNLESDLAKILKPLERMFARLNDRVFGALLIEAMQDYHEALSNMDSAFVQARLWSLLERLTNTQADDSRSTIRRATFLSVAADEHRLRLKHFAQVRNEFVHRRVRAPFIDYLAENLRDWAEEMLIYLFFVKRKFRDLDFFFKLLDAPHSKREIERQLSVLRIANQLAK